MRVFAGHCPLDVSMLEAEVRPAIMSAAKPFHAESILLD
jgi:hypothetical protein